MVMKLPSRLAHLLPLDLEEAVVHPDVRHRRRAVRAARLGDLVLVVREDEVEAAGVDVEDLAEVALAHRRALDVPARTSPAPRRVPARLLGARLLPEHEVGGVLLVRLDGDAGARDVVLEVAARERAVVGHRVRPGTALRPPPRRRGRAGRACRSAPASRRCCRSPAARPSASGSRAPRRPSRTARAVVSVTLRIASLSGRPGKSRAARALILSSTSVMLRT